jgi:23S rRNA pseudouridine1911/1915/1917 synthase
MKKNIYTITGEIKPERLDIFLSLKSSLTRSQVQKLIRQGMVTVNSNIERTGYKIKQNDRIELTIPDEPEGILIPEQIPIDIIWEDEHIIAVNKPPHMVVYPAAGNTTGTLMNALLSKCKKFSSVGAPLRPGVVHRLDKDTSGAIVIAKDDASYFNLIEQFKKRTIEKHYLAILYSNVKTDHGEIKASIGRSVSNRKKMSVKKEGGKEAITQFEVIKRFKAATLVNVKILTGRTHQIRVHFASISKPVLGDKTYGKKTELKLKDNTLTFKRQMLHAYSLKIKHPITGKELKFTAPIPEDMEKAIEELDEYSSKQLIDYSKVV